MHLKNLIKVNECAAILILKMEENMQHFQDIMVYYFKKGKNTTETQQKICAVYGEGAATDQTCQKWFAKFHAGDFLLNNVYSPVEVDSNQIKTLIEDNQHYAMQETAGILKTYKSIIKLLVKMKNVSFIFSQKLNRLFGQHNKKRLKTE